MSAWQCSCLDAMIAAVSGYVGVVDLERLAPHSREPDHTLADVERCQDLIGFVPRPPDLESSVAAIARGVATPASA